MRKLIALFLVLALSLGLSSALADHTVTVTGSGETLVPADTAVVTLGVSARNTDVLMAQATVNRSIAHIRESLLAHSFAPEDINTGYISIYAVYDYSGDVEQITAYNASSTLAIMVRDMTRIGDVIDVSFASGANTLDGITFSVTDDSAARAEALKAAVRDAKDKAAVLAEAAGFGEIEIESIQEGGVFRYDSGVNNFSAKATGREEAADYGTFVQSAKLSVSATVTITFTVK